jgi:hypothetical protein
MFMRCVVTVIAGLMFSAGAGQSQEPAWHWEKPNFDQAQFQKDVYECMIQSKGNSDFDRAYGFNPVLRDQCLRARGYQQVLNQPKGRR